MSTKIETVILSQLVNDDEYMRKTIPFLKRDYFLDSNEKLVYDKIVEFIESYNSKPNKEALIIATQNNKSLNEDQYKEICDLIKDRKSTRLNSSHT